MIFTTCPNGLTRSFKPSSLRHRAVNLAQTTLPLPWKTKREVNRHCENFFTFFIKKVIHQNSRKNNNTVLTFVLESMLSLEPLLDGLPTGK
jgi:hypothetical protein